MDAQNAAMLIKVDQDVFSFVWTINNYSTQLELGAVESPVFAEVQRITTAELNKSENCEGDIEIHLVLIDSGNEDSKDAEVRAKFQFSIIDADGQPSFQRGGPGMKIIRFSGPIDKWGYDDFAPADLLNPSNLAVDDKVKILCKIWISEDRDEAQGNQINPSHEDRFRMSKDGIVDDLARSAVFAAMFNSGMLENRSNFVEIADFEDDVCWSISTLENGLYGRVSSGTSQIAEKYDLGGLKADCVYELGDKLNLENAGELLVLAQTHNAPDLKPELWIL
ncbi:Speckle-type POZ protein B [Orchesella cincta]|uniref:Speckle-type POZ protein B n=1 Tax=Orchesella cincta TaxID=48709 RepID=A0A1D2MAY8_ORCCI|nr:Speckle-type POZ protein B [Orchesella cincta]